MQKKIFFKLCLVLGGLGIASCSNHSAWWNNGEYEYQATENETFSETVVAEPVKTTDVFMDDAFDPSLTYNKRIPPLNSLIVCRDKQCAPAELSISKEYIYNALAHLVDNNLDTTALLCEANPQAHVCVNPYLTVPAKIGVTPAYVFFDGVKFIDASVVKGKTAINLVLGYDLSYNGQTPTVCKPDTAMLYVKGNNEVVLNGQGFKCDMTSVGTTTIRMMFAIDYIDLDYGYLGGYYSIGLSGPANGGGTGYAMIRLTKDAHPLKPNLKAPRKNKSQASQIRVKPIEASNSQTPVFPVGEAAVSESNGAVNGTENSKINFDNQNVKDNVNSAHPVEIVPNHTTETDVPIVQPQIIGDDSYQEISVDDLEDYIK